MKKLFFFAMVALGMTAACQKPNVEVENPDLDDNAPVEVKFGVNAPSITVTKTKAAVDDWNAEKIYIYGYDVTLGKSTDDPKFELTNMLIQGAEATVKTVTDENPGAADVSDGLTFTPNAAGVTKYYYEVDSIYEFYGYYVGDGDITDGPTVDPTTKKITATVEIDGNDDIMLAKTDHTADITKAQVAFPDVTINEDYVYSAYAARRGVHPTLNFSHKLTRFTFNIVQGYSPNTVEGHTKPVEITGITINTNYKGVIDLIAQEYTKTSDTKTLEFPISNGDPTEDSKPVADIMLFPTNQPLVFYVSLQAVEDQENPDQNTDDLELKDMKVTLDPTVIAANTGKEFKEGQRYNITLTVYDLEEIQVSASLTEWGEGGSSVYDPDNDLDVEAGATIIETEATLNETTDVTLYSKVAIANEVRVYKNKALTNPTADGDYTTTAASFKVSNGKVTDYTQK